MKIATLENALAKAFCEGFSVQSLPMGCAVATPFSDGMGDLLTFFIRDGEDGFILEDDGEFISMAIASGVPLDSGNRAEMLDDALAPARATWDRETCEVRSDPWSASDLPAGMIAFVSSLLRAREVARLSPERVRSTFVEDATEMLEQALDADFILESADANDDNAPDILARPRNGGPTGAIYLVSNAAKLLQALIRHMDAANDGGDGERVAAILEASDSPMIGRSRFEMALNRGLQMSSFRGHETFAIKRTRDIIAGG